MTCPKIVLHSNNMIKNVKVILRRERKFYPLEFRERVLDAYYNRDESPNMTNHQLKQFYMS